MYMVRLEYVDDGKEVNVYIDGPNKKLLEAWIHLTILVADTVRIPLPVLLTMCSILEGRVKDLSRQTEKIRIDLSNLPRKD